MICLGFSTMTLNVARISKETYFNIIKMLFSPRFNMILLFPPNAEVVLMKIWCVFNDGLKITDPVQWPSPVFVRVGTSWPQRCSHAWRPHRCPAWVGWMAESILQICLSMRPFILKFRSLYMLHVSLCVCLEKSNRHILFALKVVCFSLNDEVG